MPILSAPLSNTQRPLSIEVTEGSPMQVEFTNENLNDFAFQLRCELASKFNGRVRPLGCEVVFPNNGITATPIIRLRRSSNEFVPTLRAEFENMVRVLSQANPEDGVLVLDVGFSQSNTFWANGENAFSDFLYLFARVIKKPN